jgi:hypothetical protein
MYNQAPGCIESQGAKNTQKRLYYDMMQHDLIGFIQLYRNTCYEVDFVPTFELQLGETLVSCTSIARSIISTLNVSGIFDRMGTIPSGKTKRLFR